MSQGPSNERLIRQSTAVAIGFAAMWTGVLAMMLWTHAWILDAHGRPLVTDFLEVWVAGKTTLAGHAAAAYDPKLHYAAEAAAAGHGFRGHLWWHYPPLTLFFAAALALVPYLTAFLLWAGSTTVLYGVAVSAISRSRLPAFVALGAPAVFLNAVCGQNGCFTAALFGAALLNLEERPILGGVCVGLLTYKPQFGVLFPVALAASGRWRVIVVAAIVSLLGLIAPIGVFGADILRTFLHYLPLAGQTMLVKNPTGWAKLQSFYALARLAGLGDSIAWTLQLGAAFCAMLTLAWLWRRDAPYDLKAAALPAAALLATPYLYMYDFPVLTISIAFLYRNGGLDQVELVGIALANMLILAYAFGICVAPVGPFAAILGCCLIARRLRAASDRSRASQIETGREPGHGLQKRHVHV